MSRCTVSSVRRPTLSTRSRSIRFGIRFGIRLGIRLAVRLSIRGAIFAGFWLTDSLLGDSLGDY